MKRIFKLVFFVVGLQLFFSSCAIHNGYICNSASLNQANFSYVNKNISGTASTLKFLGIGGLERQAIVAEAKKNMLIGIPLKSNQTLANITINWKRGFFLIITTTECTVTADIVEFYLNDKAREKENLNTQKVNSNPKKIKVGDKVQFRNTFRKVNGTISKIDGDCYYVKFINKKGIKKTEKFYDKSWLKKIE